LLLGAGGLDVFDSLTLSFSTLATGGFSPYQDNVGHFAGNYVKSVTAIFLFISAANLTSFYPVIAQKSFSPLLKDPELRFYVTIMLSVGTLVSILLYRGGIFLSPGTSILQGFFHTISMLSTCGFFTTNYDVWPASIRFLMIALMYCGGCAISAAGGINCIRILVIIRHVRSEFFRLLHPRAIVPVRIGTERLEPKVVSACFSFFTAYIGISVLGFVMLTAFGMDLTSAISGVAATLGNVGPGFGMAGPSVGYAALPDTVKVVYICLMLCGRLEIFTLLVIFTPRFWKL
jgi:trk system potassium uptake protein TrkH